MKYSNHQTKYIGN